MCTNIILLELKKGFHVTLIKEDLCRVPIYMNIEGRGPYNVMVSPLELFPNDTQLFDLFPADKKNGRMNGP